MMEVKNRGFCERRVRGCCCCRTDGRNAIRNSQNPHVREDAGAILFTMSVLSPAFAAEPSVHWRQQRHQRPSMLKSAVTIQRRPQTALAQPPFLLNLARGPESVSTSRVIMINLLVYQRPAVWLLPSCLPHVSPFTCARITTTTATRQQQ